MAGEQIIRPGGGQSIWDKVTGWVGNIIGANDWKGGTLNQANNQILTGNREGIGGRTANGITGSTGQQVSFAPDQVAPQRDTTYDLWGGKAAYDALRGQYAGQKSSLLDSINQRLAQEGQTYGRGVEDFLTGAQRTLTGINQKAAQNELARSQGRSDILGKVSRGIKSGNVMLGQKNASNSSAAAAIANAYGDIGNRDNMKVEQGYQLNNEAINTDLGNFTQDTQRTARRLEEDKNNIINTIVNDATSQLQALDAQIAGASLPDRIAIEQEKNRIRSEASGKLSAYDAQLNQARGLQGMTLDQRRAEAQRLASLGMAAENPFQFQPEANMQAQAGPVADYGLPIYTLPRKRI